MISLEYWKYTLHQALNVDFFSVFHVFEFNASLIQFTKLYPPSSGVPWRVYNVV